MSTTTRLGLPLTDNRTETFENWSKGINDAASGVSAFKKIDDSVALIPVKYTGSVPTTDWSGEAAPYSKAVTVTGMLADDEDVVVDLDLSASSYLDVANIQLAWGKIYRIAISANTLTFYASEVPTVAIPFIALVVR